MAEQTVIKESYDDIVKELMTDHKDWPWFYSNHDSINGVFRAPSLHAAQLHVGVAFVCPYKVPRAKVVSTLPVDVVISDQEIEIVSPDHELYTVARVDQKGTECNFVAYASNPKDAVLTMKEVDKSADVSWIATLCKPQDIRRASAGSIFGTMIAAKRSNRDWMQNDVSELEKEITRLTKRLAETEELARMHRDMLQRNIDEETQLMQCRSKVQLFEIEKNCM